MKSEDNTSAERRKESGDDGLEVDSAKQRRRRGEGRLTY
jgi:hypothetical protein